MSMWRDCLIDIEPYVAGEQPTKPGVLKLNANENPYPPAPGVEDAVRGFSVASLRRYPQIDNDALRQAAAEYYGVAPGSVFAANGSDEALAFAFRAFFNSGRPVLFPDVTYSFYPVWCDFYGIPYERIPLDGEFRANPQDYARENGGVVLANPNAPTGIEMGREGLERLIEGNSGSVVIIDEAYADFGGMSAVGLTARHENLLVVRTFSKGRSLAGMRVGLAFGSQELVGALAAVKNSFNSYPLDSVAQAAAIASLADEAYFRERSAQVAATRERVKKELFGMGFRGTDSVANFLFVTHEGVSAKKLQDWLKERDILVRRFDLPRIGEYLRITVGTDEDMDVLLARIKAYLGR
ncbi:MAG: histidinol-phosphate transaminase [Clostridiales Family XIII bacterium]|jgi:histidinol-phosphate aminotransferase|nr:histidinol-phosphate transaminase [Clostridiales Family XIII bacterium]